MNQEEQTTMNPLQSDPSFKQHEINNQFSTNDATDLSYTSPEANVHIIDESCGYKDFGNTND